MMLDWPAILRNDGFLPCEMEMVSYSSTGYCMINIEISIERIVFL